MIIKSLRAKNFMRFASIDLSGLPESGEIGVIGDNEGGKTTLGECIAFSLFGRTVRTEETDPAQVINWNADECTTSISVRVADRDVLTIDRGIGRSGAMSAKLTSADGSVLAEGVGPVDDALPRLLGFNFPEFRYSFYVAQKEIDIIRHARRDNTRQIVYDMLGITSVQNACSSVQDEIDELTQKSETLDRDLAVAQALQTSLEVSPSDLGSYQDERAQADDAIAGTLAAEEASRTTVGQARALRSSRELVLSSYAVFRASFLRGHYQKRLERLAPSLEAIASFVDRFGVDAQNGSLRNDKQRAQTRDKLTKLSKASVEIKELRALVASRHRFLSHELTNGADANTPSTTHAGSLDVFQRQVDTQTGRAGRAGASLALWLTTALALGGTGAAILTDKLDISGPDLPLGLNPDQVGAALVALAVIAALNMIGSLRARSKLKAGISEAEGHVVRLRTNLDSFRAESAACAEYRDAQLAYIERSVRAIDNVEISQKFQRLRAEVGELLSSTASIDEMLESEREHRQELEKEREELLPRLNWSLQAQRRCQALTERMESREAASVTGGEAPAELLSLIEAREISEIDEQLLTIDAKAIQASLALEALAHDDSAKPVPEAAKAMHTALIDHFDQLEGGGDARRDYEQNSQLVSLLKGGHAGAGLEAALRKEARLINDLVGSAEQRDADLEQARTTLYTCQEQRIVAEGRRQSLDSRNETLKAQRQRSDELTVKVAGLENALAPIHRELRIRRELIGLFAETIEGMKARFGPNVARYIELMLPRITRNRYRKVQLTPELDIRVYSNERNDFVRLIDLSFGTSDQILLALRLGLAKALVHSRGITNGQQFMYLDEPLEAFDETRSQAFLELLQTFDDNFAQIFVSSTRKLDIEFETTINLRIEDDVLSLTSSS